MKAWIARRRGAGNLLEAPARIGETPEPFDLIVVEVTDQGQRRPAKVARLLRAGTKTVVAELLNPKLTWWRNWKFVLTGIEEYPEQHGRTGGSQSWVCQLAVPRGAYLRAVWTHDRGVALARRHLRDRNASSSFGTLSVSSEFAPDLGRHTFQATLARIGTSFAPHILVECELEWMSSETFELAGLYSRAVYGERPAALIRHGWFCRIEAPPDDEPDSHRMKSDR